MTQDLIDQFIAEAKRAHAAHPAVSTVTIAHAVTYALNQQAMDRRAAKPDVKLSGAATGPAGAIQYGRGIASNEFAVMDDRVARRQRAEEYIKRNGVQGYATALDMVIFAEREMALKKVPDHLMQGRDFL